MRTTSVSNGRSSILLMLTSEKRPVADEQLNEVKRRHGTRTVRNQRVSSQCPILF